MKLCTSCDAQFPDDLGRCIHCGRSLDPPRARRAAQPAKRTIPDEMVLYRTREPLYAPPLLDALRMAEIRFLAVGDRGQWRPKGGSGNNGHDAMIEIYVDREHLERAHLAETELLRMTLPDIAPDHDPGAGSGDRCPACDTQLRVDQMTCPSCGLPFG